MSIATMHDIDVALAEEVRVMIARRQVKQRAIAEAIGITPMALSRRLSGDVPISAAELLRIAEVLHCRPTDLLPHLDSNQEPFDYSLGDHPFQFGYTLVA